MAFDGRSVVDEGRQVTVTVPYEPGSDVDVRVEPHTEPVRQSAAEIVAGLRELARWLKEKYPDAPLLSDEDISRESIYADAGL